MKHSRHRFCDSWKQWTSGFVISCPFSSLEVCILHISALLYDGTTNRYSNWNTTNNSGFIHLLSSMAASIMSWLKIFVVHCNSVLWICDDRGWTVGFIDKYEFQI